jgi:hypothetical protein
MAFSGNQETVLITSAGDSESLATLVVLVYSTLNLQINKVRIKACKPWLHTYLPVIAAVFPANTGYVALIHCRRCCAMIFYVHSARSKKSQKGAVYSCPCIVR